MATGKAISQHKQLAMGKGYAKGGSVAPAPKNMTDAFKKGGAVEKEPDADDKKKPGK